VFTADTRADRLDGVPKPKGCGLTVLVVEDDADTAASTALLLRLHGHQAVVAPTGPAALAAAGSNAPDVVLLDLGLPGMDGLDVARRIRGRCGGKPPFLIALTGHGRDVDRRRAAESGIDLFLVKPADPEALLGVLRRFGRVVA